jgi:hypothetical protein
MTEVDLLDPDSTAGRLPGAGSVESRLVGEFSTPQPTLRGTHLPQNRLPVEFQHALSLATDCQSRRNRG